MALPDVITLPEAAKLLRVHKCTLRRWLRIDLGIDFGPPKRGAKRFILKKDLELVLRRHTGSRNPVLLRNSLHVKRTA